MLAGNVVVTVVGGVLGLIYAVASQQGPLATLAFYQLGGLIAMLSFLILVIPQQNHLR